MKVKKEIVEKRRNEILKIIQSKNSITVENLSEMFKISSITIRRDLQYWEEKGAIIRNYGGAALVQEFIENKDYEKERYMHAIAKKAASFIENDDVVFINSARTALMVINFIKDKNVTVITNNAKAINITPDPKVTIVFTGGEVKYPKNSLTGDFALAHIRSVTANKCFLGCSGLNSKGTMTAILAETQINSMMLERTIGKRYILCDSTKIGLTYNFTYSDLHNVDYIVTDKNANDEILDSIRIEHDIEIIKVDPLNKNYI